MDTTNTTDSSRPLGSSSRPPGSNGRLTNVLSLAPGDRPESLQELGDELRRRFVPAAAKAMDLRVDLDTGIAVLIRLRIRQAELELSFLSRDSIDNTPETEMPKADLRLYFPDPETGRALLLGTDNAIEAFMRGDFRSDGYLILVFQLLNVFHNSG